MKTYLSSLAVSPPTHIAMIVLTACLFPSTPRNGDGIGRGRRRGVVGAPSSRATRITPVLPPPPPSPSSLPSLAATVQDIGTVATEWADIPLRKRIELRNSRDCPADPCLYMPSSFFPFIWRMA